jgi:3'(2'), 5'-bisphosphate nucleotidase
MYQRELTVCLSLMETAGRLAMEVYRTDFQVDFKTAADPVTEADRRLNDYLATELERAFPGDRVIGEESVQGGGTDGHRVWFVDPIDGTAEFVERNGEWSVMIGLVVDGKPRVGVVYQPATSDLYFAASGAGAFHQIGATRRQLRVSDDDCVANATAVLSRNHPDPRVFQTMEAVGVHRSYRHGSIGCKLAQIAEHRADLYLNFAGRCHMWDLAGPEVILREAGGAVVDLNGQPLRYSGESTLIDTPFVATTGRLLPTLLSHFSALPGAGETQPV